MANNATRWVLLAAVAAAGGVIAAGRRHRRQPERGHRRQPDRQDGWYVVRRGVTVDRPMQAVIGFWSDQQRLDAAVGEWVALKQLDGDRWHCVARDPVGADHEWRAEITVEGPGQLRWRVPDGSQEGRIELVAAPAGRGTEIRAELRYRSRGSFGRVFGLVTGHDPDQRLRSVLRRVKSMIECGRVMDTRGEPSGRGPRQEKATNAVREKLMMGGRA